MAVEAESIKAYDLGNNPDWDTPYTTTPSSTVGELSDGANPVYPDMHATSFSETSRSPYDGDTSRSQGKFPTGDDRAS